MVFGNVKIITSQGRCFTGMQWVESRNAAKHPIRYRTVHTIKNYWAHHVSGAKTEKP